MTYAPANSDSIGIIILGNSGVGKSFIGNIILDQEAFKHAYKSNAVTTKTEHQDCRIGDKVYAVYNIPGLIENDQARIDINKLEIGIAFKEHPYAVVLYVFGNSGGRIRNEDVVAFNAINSAYPLSEQSLVVIVNGLESDRPSDYESETTPLLTELLKKRFCDIHYISKIRSSDEKKALRQQLIQTVTAALPKTHDKKQDIHLQLEELSKLTKQIAAFQLQIAEDREQQRLELERVKTEFDAKQRQQKKEQEELARKYEKKTGRISA